MKTMKKNFKLYIGLAILGFASSCAPSLDELEASKGTADFSKFIAVGNSLTSGYADNGLYLEGQKVAFPNLMAEQLRLLVVVNSPLLSSVRTKRTVQVIFN